MFDFRNLKNSLKKRAVSLPQIDAAEIKAQLLAWTEKVKKRRASIYLAVASAMVWYPKET